MNRRVLALGAAAVLVFAGTGVASAQSHVQGVDVSEYQSTIDWGRAKNAGIGFGICRVSDGAFHKDGTFRANWNGMKAHGVVRGVYQFFRPNEDPVAQADLLVNEVGGFAADDLPPICDVEVMDGVGAGTLAAHLRTWCDHVKARTGMTPMIYTAPGFWNPLGANFSGDDLWVANWFVSAPHLPSGWGNWVFWQYSDSGSVPGIPGRVDLDVFHGSMADLLAYARRGTRPSGGGSGGSGGGSGGGASNGGHPTLTYGARGPEVTLLQRLLTAKGYGTGAIDGVFGPKTEAAVKKFQAAHGLLADGIVGPRTWAALLSGGGNVSHPGGSTHPTGGTHTRPPRPTSHPTLRPGDRGPAVSDLQRRLKAKGFNPGPIDGDFGRRTEAAVKAFQRSRRLPVSGIVGPRTWAALVK